MHTIEPEFAMDEKSEKLFFLIRTYSKSELDV
jgi:hypothetical protein